jgi:hypothetical protein
MQTANFPNPFQVGMAVIICIMSMVSSADALDIYGLMICQGEPKTYTLADFLYPPTSSLQA